MNVIVIVADSLRYDHLGCSGNEWIKTPNLDRFAEEGTVFERAYSEGLPTLPTRTAMFTGRFTFPFRGWGPLRPEDIVLAEVLWDKGYKTALITDTYHMHKPKMCYERGFDYVEFIRGQENDPYVQDKSIKVDVDAVYKSDGKDTKIRAQMEQYLRNIAHWKTDEDHFVAQVTKAGLRWLERQEKRDRLFLWLDCFDPHEPWDPPEEFWRPYDPDYQGRHITQPIPGISEDYLTEEEERHIRALYAGEVTLVDKWVGIFLHKLRELGLWENTLIIFTTDHGEPLGRGESGHGIIRKARPWPYEELVHIPFILRHPQGAGASKRVDGLVETCDMMPTILDFLGVPFPPRMHGKSILPLLTGEAESIRDWAYSGFYLRAWSIRDKEWSFILWLPEIPAVKQAMPGTLGAISCTLVGTLETPESPELYHIASDPYEQSNLIDKEPARAARMELELRRFVSSLI